MRKNDFRKLLAAFLTWFTCVYSIILTLWDVPQENMSNANTILGFLYGVALSAIVGVYFAGTEEPDKEPDKNDKNPG